MQKAIHVRGYLQELRRFSSVENKVQFLLSDPSVRDVLAKFSFLREYLQGRPKEVHYVFLALIKAALDSTS